MLKRLAALVLLAAAAPAERVVTGDGIVSVRINNVPGRLRIEPGGTAMPLLAGAYAMRAGLRSGMFGVSYAIGPIRIDGATAVARIDLGQGPGKRRVAWADRPAPDGVDAVIGPGGVPEPVVRFVLGPARPGERTVALPMVGRGGLAGRWGELWGLVTVGGRPLRIRFDPHRGDTVATANAGVRLAAALGGTWAGAAGQAPIAFGVVRPVRTLALATPLPIGPLAVTRLGIRTGDEGNAAGIREAGDPDEVLVAGGKANPDRDRLILGADQLARCSSLVFDKAAKVIKLTC